MSALPLFSALGPLPFALAITGGLVSVVLFVQASAYERARAEYREKRRLLQDGG